METEYIEIRFGAAAVFRSMRISRQENTGL